MQALAQVDVPIADEAQGAALRHEGGAFGKLDGEEFHLLSLEDDHYLARAFHSNEVFVVDWRRRRMFCERRGVCRVVFPRGRRHVLLTHLDVADVAEPAHAEA